MGLTIAAMLFALPAPLARFFPVAGASARPRVTRFYAAHVQAGRTRELTPPRGKVTLHCRQGEAWITHDGDPKDVMLRAQESHTVDRGNRMTLHAMRGDCVFEIQVED